MMGCLLVAILLAVVEFVIHKAYDSTHTKGDIVQVYQLVDDWSAIPFVELSVHEGEMCPADTEVAFYNDWQGTTRGCWNKDGEIYHADAKKDYRIAPGVGFVETKYDYDRNHYQGDNTR